MGKVLNVPVPVINDSYYDSSQVAQLSNSLAGIQNNLSAYITTASKLTLLPESLIVSVIFIESSGRNVPKNSDGSIGYMQINAPTIYDTIRLLNYAGRLSGDEVGMINKYVPNADLAMTGSQFRNWSIGDAEPDLDQALTNPEFNIFCGSLYLRYAIDKNMDGSKPRLDKAISFYNFGIYRALYQSPSWKQSDTSSLYKSPYLPDITKDYILKLLGVNGTLDILINNKS